MRTALSLSVFLWVAHSTFADGLLPNLPAEWVPVDSPLEATGSGASRVELRINRENGDVLIASRFENDRDGSLTPASEEQNFDRARRSLQSWWSVDTVSEAEKLRGRDSVLASRRTTPTRDGRKRGKVSKHPVTLTTFRLKFDDEPVTVNGFAFDKNGGHFVYQHASTRGITDKTMLHIGSWAIRHAQPDAR